MISVLEHIHLTIIQKTWCCLLFLWKQVLLTDVCLYEFSVFYGISLCFASVTVLSAATFGEW